MRIRWRNFELPSKVQPDRETLSKSYGRFVIEPFERGFGHTIGTGLRRVLLSSISGAAVTSVRIAGANHEFDSLEGVYEDIADLILNLKQLRIQYDGDHPIICKIRRNGEEDVTGADVECPGEARSNPNLHLCSLTMDRELEIDLEVKRGRGYVSAEENREETGTGHHPRGLDLLAGAPRALRHRGHPRGQVHQLRPVGARDLDRRHPHARAGADRGRQDLP
ncbi:MAG: hypothetical protein R3E96_04525 [Planctomycetota bacterium]